MKKITQTGNISMGSMGILLKNYLRFFKVYFVFYVIPFISICSVIYFTNKEKILIVFQNLMQLIILSKIAPGNQVLTNAANDALIQSLSNLFSSPSYVVIWIIAMILWLIFASCLFVGLKHTFYKRVSIISIFKEGFSKTLWCLWTMVTLFFFSIIIGFIIGVLSGVLMSVIMVILAMVLGKYAIPLMVVLYFIFFCIVVSPFIFYIPIHFFSDNDPFSSLWYSVKTFWHNLFSLIGMGIVFLIIGLLATTVVMLIIGIPVYMYMKAGNPELARNILMIKLNYVLLPILYLFIPYTIMGYFMPFLQIFVAYPQLLDENQADNNFSGPVNYNSGDDCPALPTEFFNGSAIRKISEGNSSGNQSLNNNDIAASNPIAKSSNAGAGLSMPNNHANNRPFLNQKLDQTEFDRLTSKDEK